MRKALILFLLFPFLSKAQSGKQVIHQNLFWMRYNNQLILNQKWIIQSEVDNRMFLSPVKEHHLVTRAQARYALNPAVTLGAGLTYALQHPQNPDSESDLVVPELRPQQDITLKQTLGKVILSHRYQVDERFIRKADGEQLSKTYTFNFRFRYRLQGEIHVFKTAKNELKMVLNDEVMLNTGKNVQLNTFDQNRIYAGLQWGLSPQMALELGYMNWYQQRPSGKEFYQRNITRLSLFHKLDLYNN
ncbi:DUF2490 domain-containing protein [Pontibacter silvestris]|uniref:DUF2490 domain-containing protein n=1 Tax=Pontibacter silvestris TaxID=2305183 RepID=A0ABW4X1D4_9BACT|nr:DUF2490 domain-containing protein [Pontibacter silvestris]MCC9135465.1 DUF2490 domain-containing protein [Pontibacter silvestris]